MKHSLNGWRRFGIVIVALWLLGVATVTIVEYVSASQGFFVYQTIPVGTIFEGDKVKLPNGKVVAINNRDPTTGQLLSPWEIDWSKQSEVPKTTRIHWLRFVLLLVLVPIIAWLVSEVIVIVISWVIRGFRNSV